MATEFIVVRHGQTIWNTETRFQGHTDVPLNDCGREQARAVARRLAKVRIDAAYCSNLGRCVETARIILEGHSLTAVQRPDLQEASHGLWEGMTQKEVEDRYPEQVRLRLLDPEHYGASEGEAMGQTQERLWGAVLDIAGKHPDSVVLLVTHGGPVRALVSKVLDLDLTRCYRIGIANAAITRFRVDPRRHPTLLLMNDTCHLDGDE